MVNLFHSSIQLRGDDVPLLGLLSDIVYKQAPEGHSFRTFTLDSLRQGAQTVVAFSQIVDGPQRIKPVIINGFPLNGGLNQFQLAIEH